MASACLTTPSRHRATHAQSKCDMKHETLGYATIAIMNTKVENRALCFKEGTKGHTCGALVIETTMVSHSRLNLVFLFMFFFFFVKFGILQTFSEMINLSFSQVLKV